MNILFLMAGSSSVKQDLYPKNLVEINGSPLIQIVTETFLSLNSSSTKFIYMINKSENEKYYTKNVIKLINPKAEVIEVPSETKGAACTALLGIEYINNDEPLVIINGDIILKEDMKPVIESFKKENLDGGIVTFQSVHPRWSYVKCSDEGFVVEVAEKKPISKIATAGIYYFGKGKDFVEGSMNMIRKDIEVNGAYFVSLVYNELILKQFKIKIHEIERKKYFSLSKAGDIRKYEDYLSSNYGEGVYEEE